jgi:hypothetical protein
MNNDNNKEIKSSNIIQVKNTNKSSYKNKGPRSIKNRGLSPRDKTKIKINGETFDRQAILNINSNIDSQIVPQTRKNNINVSSGNTKIIPLKPIFNISNKNVSIEHTTQAKTEATSVAEHTTQAKTEATSVAENEAKAKAEATLLAENEAKAKAKATLLAENEAKARAKAEVTLLAENEAKARAKAEVTLLAENEAKAKAEATLLAENEAKAKAEATLLAENEANAKAKATLLAENEAKAKAKATLLAENEAKATLLAENEAKATLLAENEAKAEAKVLVVSNNKREKFLKTVESSTKSSTTKINPLIKIQRPVSPRAIQLIDNYPEEELVINATPVMLNNENKSNMFKLNQQKATSIEIVPVEKTTIIPVEKTTIVQSRCVSKSPTHNKSKEVKSLSNIRNEDVKILKTVAIKTSTTINHKLDIKTPSVKPKAVSKTLEIKTQSVKPKAVSKTLEIKTPPVKPKAVIKTLEIKTPPVKPKVVIKTHLVKPKAIIKPSSVKPKAVTKAVIKPTSVNPKVVTKAVIKPTSVKPKVVTKARPTNVKSTDSKSVKNRTSPKPVNFAQTTARSTVRTTVNQRKPPPVAQSDIKYMAASPHMPVIPDFSELSILEITDIKATFRIKMGRLRESWPNFRIPDYSDEDSLEVIYVRYARWIKHIEVNMNADYYRKYLMTLWAFMEFGLVYLGLPAGGFIKSQIKSMNKYQNLLIEMGERETSTVGSSWPTEGRLLVTCLFQLSFFIMLNLLAKWLGPDIGETGVNLIRNFLDESNHSAIQQVSDIHGVNIPDPPQNTGGGLDFASIATGLGGIWSNFNNRNSNSNNSNSNTRNSSSTRRKSRRRGPRWRG